MFKRNTVCFLVLGTLAAGAGLWPRQASRPLGNGYVNSQQCISCHPSEGERWKNSPHDRAMMAATPANVVGSFDNVVFEDTRLTRDGSDYIFEIREGDKVMGRHRVSYTFGAEPLQQYLLEMPGGRLQASALAWDTEKGQWFRVQAQEFHFSSRYQNWNTMCADCHSTNVDKRYKPSTDTFETTFSEIDVGCQSCHGPGERHAEDPSTPLSVRTDVEACAPCHSRRSPLTPKADLTEPLTDHYRPSTLRPGLYFPDGQINDEVFEYGSFAQSLMYERGVRCIDCHDPHSAKKASDNSTCTQCHGSSPPVDRFPSLAQRAKDLDRPEHHRHQAGSAGAQCVACHMPSRRYLGVDVRHDHRFSIPRPDLSQKLGTPNACSNGCHQNRDAAWATSVLEDWFPKQRPRAEHFGEVLARAQLGIAEPAALSAVATSTEAAIVRASALEYLVVMDTATCVEAAGELLADPSPLVRSVAVGCGEHLPAERRVRFAAGALADERRLVRLEAARVLIGVADHLDRSEDRQRFRSARRELESMYTSQRDRPEGSFNLALLAEAEGRLSEAQSFYEEALRLDASFTPARVNLSLLRRRLASSQLSPQTR